MGKITDEILKAVEIIVDKKLKSLPFDRTAEGKVIGRTKTGYLVCVEGSNLDIPVPGNAFFNPGDTVKVLIPQNNLRNAYLKGVETYLQNQAVEREPDNIQSREYTSGEKAIGTWNGKTLYRQVITVDTPVSVAATTWYAIKNIAPNLNVVNLSGTWRYANEIYPFCYGSYHLYYIKTSGIVRFYNPSSNAQTFYGFRVIIEYTH